MTYWAIDDLNPVVSPGSLHPAFDKGRAGASHVIELDGGYRMVYWGSDQADQHYILQAQSSASNPNDWQPLGKVMIGPQTDTSHNCSGPSFPFLLPITDTHWLLYYCAWGRSVDGKLPNTTGLAISKDRGATWRYHEQHPIIPLDRPYDAEGTGSVWVLREHDRFRMYYTSIGRYFARPEGVATGHGNTIPEVGIGYAESEDGIHWEKPVDQLVVAPRGFGITPYEYICSKPCVIHDGSRYTMWVNTYGTAYRVHRLTSTDGLHWEWGERVGPDGELDVGAACSFDDEQRSYPTILSANGKRHCWFTGNGFGKTGMGYAVDSECINKD